MKKPAITVLALLLHGCSGVGGFMAAGAAQGVGDAMNGSPQQQQQQPQRFASGFYTGEQTVNGLKYCNYSNNAVMTVNSYQACPMQIY